MRPVCLVILDGWGIAPPGPGNAVDLAETPVFDALVGAVSARHARRFGRGGRAPGRADGELGGRPSHDRVGSDPVAGSRAREPGRRGRLVRHETRRSRRRSDARASAAADVHLLGLVSYGGVHSHIDHLRALLALAEREEMARADLDPCVHRRARRVAACGGERPRRAARATGSRRYAAATTRWIATTAGSAPTVRATRSSPESGAHADDPVAAVRASYERGVTDEFVEPVVLEGRPRLAPDDAAIFFNFRPDRARQLSERLLEARSNLTTMTRYRADFPFPVAFDEQEVQQHARRGPGRARPAPAPRRRDGEVRTRDVLLQRRGGDGVAGRDADPRALAPRRPELRPEARDVGGRASRAGSATRSADGYAFAVVNFANPDMVGHTGSIPAVDRRRRGGGSCARTGRRRACMRPVVSVW